MNEDNRNKWNKDNVYRQTNKMNEDNRGQWVKKATKEVCSMANLFFRSFQLFICLFEETKKSNCSIE